MRAVIALHESGMKEAPYQRGALTFKSSKAKHLIRLGSTIFWRWSLFHLVNRLRV